MSFHFSDERPIAFRSSYFSYLLFSGQLFYYSKYLYSFIFHSHLYIKISNPFHSNKKSRTWIIICNCYLSSIFNNTNFVLKCLLKQKVMCTHVLLFVLDQLLCCVWHGVIDKNRHSRFNIILYYAFIWILIIIDLTLFVLANFISEWWQACWVLLFL